MKKKPLYIFVLSVLTLAGCQQTELWNNQFTDDGNVKYALASNQPELTKAAVMPEGMSLTLFNKSGSLTIPMESEVSEGISLASESAVTKGTQVNTTGDDNKTLGDFADVVGTFIAKAYDGKGNQKVSQTVTWDESSSAWVGNPVTYWPQATSLNFLAYANLPSEQSAAIASTGVSTSHTVPATAADQTDILFGYYQGNGGNTGTAEIRFEHPLTAVRFLRGEMDDDLVIKSISIEGVAESGTAMMTPDGEISWSDVDSYDYSVSLEGDATTGLELSDLDGYTAQLIGEPFLIIPQKLTDQNVEVTVTFTDGTEAAATLTSGEWKAGYTNTYTLGMRILENILTVTCDQDEVAHTGGSLNLSVSSYQSYGSQHTPLEWHFEYKNSADEWVRVPSDGGDYDIDGWIGFSSVAGSGSIAGELSTANINEATVEHRTPTADEHSQILRGRDEVAAESNPYDLSMHDIYGNSRDSGKPVTANSYVISAPGWYAFPLVYGNAIDFDSCPTDGINTIAFNPGGTSANTATFLSSFVNTHNLGIASPYIDTDLFGPEADLSGWSAFPLWQDVVDHGIVTDNAESCYVIDKAEALSRGLALGGKCGYVVFHVNKASLSQGNVLIAVKNGTDSNSYILWSWQIWVTDESLACRSLINKSGQQIEMLPFSLGWVDGAMTSIDFYEGKSIEMRAVQEASGECAYFRLSRKEYELSVSAQGACPTYEWGRKDPFIRGNGLDDNELTTISVHSGYSAITKQNANTHLPFSSIVRNPNLFLFSWDDLWYYSTVGGETCRFRNLWSATCTGLESEAQCYAGKPVKTVYDPCPPGFVVPQSNAFTGMVDGEIKYHRPNNIGPWNYGYTLKTGVGDEAVFMAATGYRDCGNGNFGRTDVWSMTWTAAPYDFKQSHYLRVTQYDSGHYESTGVDPTAYYPINFGFSVRPVKE